MADNTVLNANTTAGDSIRDLARQAGAIKTQVCQLDIGGATANAEVLVTAGQQLMAASLPVVLASNQTAVPVTGAVPVNTTTNGTLSATDAVVAAPIGDGTLVTGASTAGSIAAAVVPDGMQAWTLLIKGYVSGTIYTEASNNSTNGTDGDWVEVKGRRTGTAPGTESVVYAMVANGYYRGNAAGFKYIRARLIGGVGPTIQWVLSIGQGATFLNSGIPGGSSSIGTVVVAATTPPATYSATVNGLALAATATDIFTLTGSATKTIRITKVSFNALQTTAAQVAVVLLRRSTANTVGTSTAPTATAYDSTNVAATATALAYTANPTTGTLAGNLFTQRVFVPGAATASDAQGLMLSYGDFGQQGLVLRGIAQVFAVNLAGVSVVGGSANVSIEWNES